MEDQTFVYPAGMVGTCFNKESTQEVRAISWIPRFPIRPVMDANHTGDSHALDHRTSPYFLKKGDTLVNLRLGMTTRSGWEAAACVSNLLNKIGETDLPTTRRHAINRPRMVGLFLNLRYRPRRGPCAPIPVLCRRAIRTGRMQKKGGA